MLYDVAPDEGLQLNSTGLATPVAPLPGWRSAGTEGGLGGGADDAVLKFHTIDQELVPPEPFALTRQ